MGIKGASYGSWFIILYKMNKKINNLTSQVNFLTIENDASVMVWAAAEQSYGCLVYMC